MSIYQGYRIVEVKDWSRIPKTKLQNDNKIFCYKNINSCDSYNLGLYLNERDEYCVCGFVGICVLKDKWDRDYVDPNGNKIILKVIPRFNVSPWEMLARVMDDKEYERYAAASEELGEKFYEIFEDEKPIKLDVENSGGEVLLAISFIRLCYKICTGNLNRKMGYVHENMNGKIRGRIDFNNHIKKNVAHGREDRIFCKYPQFTEDTIENQILKKAVILSERILLVNKCLEVDGLTKIREMLAYCKRRLLHIKTIDIKKSDFLIVDIKGFNSLYAPAIKVAELVITHSSLSVSEKGDKTGYVVPYAIRMETVFEFYARSLIKDSFATNGDENEWKIEEYKDIAHKESLLKTIDVESAYLMKNYIPDIAIQHFNKESGEWEYTTVLDVKYQKSKDPNSTSVRHNTHQLLSYALLLNTKYCGFVFPDEKGYEPEKIDHPLVMQNGLIKGADRIYAEFHIGIEKNKREDEMKRMIEYVKRLGSENK